MSKKRWFAGIDAKKILEDASKAAEGAFDPEKLKNMKNAVNNAVDNAKSTADQLQKEALAQKEAYLDQRAEGEQKAQEVESQEDTVEASPKKKGLWEGFDQNIAALKQTAKSASKAAEGALGSDKIKGMKNALDSAVDSAKGAANPLKKEAPGAARHKEKKKKKT